MHSTSHAHTTPRNTVTVFTDGACLKNPGPGGYGVIIDSGHDHRELSAGYRLTTNNRMELLGVIKALECLTEPHVITLISDSTYVVNSIEKGWAVNWRAKNWLRNGVVVPNWDLWNDLLKAAEPHQIQATWVRGHTGHPENERCDVLAMAAATADALVVDVGYENLRPAVQQLLI